MNLTRQEVQLVVEELDALVVPSRIQKIFEASPKTLVLQLRAPGKTFHLLLAAEDETTRIYLVDGKPDQPDHPSPFTMQLRKWLHGAWIESIEMSPTDRIVFFDLQAIDPDWEPQSEDEKAPRLALTLIAELVGRHPNFFLVDEEGAIIGRGPGKILGDRQVEPDSPYTPPPPPPEWADDEQTRIDLDDIPADGSRSKTLAHRIESTLAQKKTKQLRSDLRSELKRRAKKLRRRVKNIEGDLSKIEDADEYRRRGELLQTAYGSVEPGAESVRVPDFYREGMPQVEIPLDPSKSLQKNIERYFHQYRRYAEAKDKVENRLLESMELRDQVEKARSRLDEIDDDEELSAFREELYDQGLLRRRARRRGSKRRQQQALPPYREFRAQSGATILVGRGAKHNDELTTAVARGRDLWLHARDWPGSHVLLRLEKKESPKSEDLIDAAILAAFFSKGRRDTVVDVTYTRAKHVRKPTGAAPGLVTVGGGSTIAVRAEGERLQRLLATEIDQQ